MNLYCTKKLLEAGNYKIEESIDNDALFSWYGNLIKVNRKNFIVFINEKTGYPIFFYGMKKKELQNIEQYFNFAIEFAFKREGYPLEYIFNYLTQASEYKVHKTVSRKVLGSLKEMIFYAESLDTWGLTEGCLNVSSLSIQCSDTFLKVGSEYVQPCKQMFNELEKLYQLKAYN